MTDPAAVTEAAIVVEAATGADPAGADPALDSTGPAILHSCNLARLQSCNLEILQSCGFITLQAHPARSFLQDCLCKIAFASSSPRTQPRNRFPSHKRWIRLEDWIRGVFLPRTDLAVDIEGILLLLLLLVLLLMPSVPQVRD